MTEGADAQTRPRGNECLDEGVFEVLATADDTQLSGEDRDNRVIDYFVK